MSGLVKGKEYKVEDSNVEALGGEEHKDAVKGVAKTEPAWKDWERYNSDDLYDKPPKNGVVAKKDKNNFLVIWRIEKFKVKFWPVDQYGSFYSGDSYICLHIYDERPAPGEDGKRFMDLYFWLGKDTTQDEMGTAAYKTVELDTLLDDLPVQHRQVEGFESDQFKDLFNTVLQGGIRYMEGGVDSGFRHVEPESYEPRLMHVKGKRKQVSTKAVDKNVSSLNDGDVFILDQGLKLFVWQGRSAGIFEKNMSGEVANKIKAERGGKPTVIFCRPGDKGGDDPSAWDSDEKDFYAGLGHDVTSPFKLKTAEEGGSDEEPPKVKELHRISDASGQLTIKLEAKDGDVNMSKLDTNDAFLLYLGTHSYVWVGNGCTTQEKNHAMDTAKKTLKQLGVNENTSITKLSEDQAKTNKDFVAQMGGK